MMIYYTIHNGGDGSAYAKFYRDEAAWLRARDLQALMDEVYGEPDWAEECGGNISTEIDAHFTTLDEIELEILELEGK